MLRQPLVELSIASLREAYESKSLTPEGMIDALYEHLESEPLIPVWIYRLSRTEALRQARELGAIDGRRHLPLYGVPFAVKDNIDVGGMPTTAGCPDFTYLPTRSAAVVRSLQQAGAICIGKVNLDQFATGLVGTRSPYGKCRNVFDAAYLSGGSSSGSALAVAKHQVTFALGTDTAGSGRIPAALNNVVGVKPTRGSFSNDGVVPACTSLDCVSILASSLDDGAIVREVITGHRASPSAIPRGFRFAVPSKLEFFGDVESERLFERALRHLTHLGGVRVPIDWSPFAQLGDMLYGPWVVERYVSVGEFLEAHPAAGLNVTRKIILGARRYTASDAFRAFNRAQELITTCLQVLRKVDLMITPTVPTHFRVEADQRDPMAVNDKLGIYTRFANFIGSPVLAVPAGFRQDGLPFGVSLIGLPGADAQLDPYGRVVHESSGAGSGLGRTVKVPNHSRHPWHPVSPSASPA